MKTLTTLPLLWRLSRAFQLPRHKARWDKPALRAAACRAANNGKCRVLHCHVPGGPLNCKYASLAACEKDAKAQNLNCSPNPKKSTTGSKQ